MAGPGLEHLCRVHQPPGQLQPGSGLRPPNRNSHQQVPRRAEPAPGALGDPGARANGQHYVYHGPGRAAGEPAAGAVVAVVARTRRPRRGRRTVGVVVAAATTRGAATAAGTRGRRGRAGARSVVAVVAVGVATTRAGSRCTRTCTAAGSRSRTTRSAVGVAAGVTPPATT